MPRNVDALFDREFDVLVVGGGIAGACAAWDAATRGMRTALVEAHDFASGASSNNLKLVHGGLRYVKRLQLGEARCAVRERRTWLRMAPHLVRTIPIVVPVYHRSLQSRVPVRLLMAASDAIALDRNRGVAADRRIPNGSMLSRDETIQLAPQLDDRSLAGGAVFHDGQIGNSERLVLEVLRAARDAGAVLGNYTSFDRALSRHGTIIGARLTDRLGQREGELRTRALVNATGGDFPGVLSRIAPDAMHRIVAYSLAMNVMIPATGLKAAISVPSRPAPGQPQRQLLWVPWRGREIIGTYHGDMVTPSSRPRPHPASVDAFLEEINRSIPGLGLQPDGILLVHAGALPLTDGGARHDLRLLRRHRILDHAGDGVAGAVSLVSVKYTTARLAAEEAINVVQRRLGGTFAHCATSHATLPAAPADARLLRESVRLRYRELPDDVIDHLVRTYGAGCTRVLESCGVDLDGHVRVVDGSPVIHAELLHGIRDEMAHTVDDVLRRRTELGARGVPDDAVLARIAHVLDHELGRHRVSPD